MRAFVIRAVGLHQTRAGQAYAVGESLGMVGPLDSLDAMAWGCGAPPTPPGTMRFGSTAKVLLKCKLKYYRISECLVNFSNVLTALVNRYKGQLLERQVPAAAAAAAVSTTI